MDLRLDFHCWSFGDALRAHELFFNVIESLRQVTSSVGSVCVSDLTPVVSYQWSVKDLLGDGSGVLCVGIIHLEGLSVS